MIMLFTYSQVSGFPCDIKAEAQNVGSNVTSLSEVVNFDGI